MGLIAQAWGPQPHSFTPGREPLAWTCVRWPQALFALIRRGFDRRSGSGPGPSLLFHKHTLECYSCAFLPSSLPLLCPLDLLLLTIHPRIRRIYLHGPSLPVTPVFLLLFFAGSFLRNDAVVTMLGIKFGLFDKRVLTWPARTQTRTDASWWRRIPSFFSFTQDPSEVKNPREHGGHPGGLPGDGHLCQGGHGSAAFLLRHHDQNHLHQLWVVQFHHQRCFHFPTGCSLNSGHNSVIPSKCDWPGGWGVRWLLSPSANQLCRNEELWAVGKSPSLPQVFVCLFVLGFFLLFYLKLSQSASSVSSVLSENWGRGSSFLFLFDPHQNSKLWLFHFF